MKSMRAIAAILYGLVTDLRRFCYDRKILKTYHSALPVVSVGNLTAGGNGKSPFVQFLASELLARGFRPVILLRGYRGSLSGPHRVSSNDTVATVGDEALMHLRHFDSRLPIVVARRRAEGARFIESANLGNIIILDDGFQHRALDRQCDLVLWALSDSSPEEELRAARLLPLGLLRERIKPALKRAKALIWVSKGRQVVQSYSAAVGLKQLHFELVPIGLRDVFSGDTQPIRGMSEQTYKIITSIAVPQSFKTLVESECGGHVEAIFSKRDHDTFSIGEWRSFVSRNRGVALCTEKDEEKLRPFLSGPGELYSVRMQGRLMEDMNEFFAILGAGSLERTAVSNF